MDEQEIRRKAKRRKYIDDHECDMSTGWGDRNGHPVVNMCPNRPVRFFPELGMFGAYLCDSCFERKLASV